MLHLAASLVLIVLHAALTVTAHAQARSTTHEMMTLASTTSTEQSGLFGHLLPIFKKVSGIEVRVVAVGSGQALSIAQRGDADAVLVHDRAGEDKLVADGHGVDRRDVMYNDFVLVGPSDDPARVRGLSILTDALARIAQVKATFASRGDDSGTHRLELRLWQRSSLGKRPETASGWYRELGSGMGATLNTASGLGAYTLADRATWASFGNRRGLDILLEGDSELFNPYGSILVNPAKGKHIRAGEAKTWHEWLTSQHGRAAIEAFRIRGAQMFFVSSQNGKS